MLAGESFQLQCEEFKSRYRVILFDLPGQGRSIKPDGSIDLDALTEDTAALIDVLHCWPCRVVGFSMGSFIAMRLAARHASLVRSNTLIAPSAAAESKRKMRACAVLILLVRLFGPRVIAGRMRVMSTTRITIF